MPSVVTQWFAKNYGTNPDGTPWYTVENGAEGQTFGPEGTGNDYTSLRGKGYVGEPKNFPTKPVQPSMRASSEEWSRYNQSYAQWARATSNGQRYGTYDVVAASRRLMSEQAATRSQAQAVQSQQQKTMQAALQRTALRNRLSAAAVPVRLDTSVLDAPKDSKPGLPVIGGAGSSAGSQFNFDSNTKVQKWGYNPKTSQFEPLYKTETQYAQPRNKWEAMLDSGPAVSATKVPITTTPQYLGDTYRIAQGWAANKGYTTRQIREWQSYFVNQARVGGDAPLVPGSFIPGVWDAATQDAMFKHMGGANRIGANVDEYRSMWQAAWNTGNGGFAPGGAASSGGSGAAARPRVETTKQFSITSLARGGTLLRQFLQQELGRDPSQGEIAAYVRKLNAQERKNPQITTTRWNSDFTSSTSTTSERNVDEADTAEDFTAGALGKELGGRQAIEMFDWIGSA